MKIINLLLFTSLLISPVKWFTNFNVAKTEAEKSHKLILLNFSGSDWCAPCIELRKTIFESEKFSEFASDNLVLVNADFPRQNKHKLNSEQKKLNETLAEKYNPQGKFPFTLLMTSEGKVLQHWDGLPDITAKQFVDGLKQQVDANH